jgi:hypothetical protein
LDTARLEKFDGIKPWVGLGASRSNRTGRGEPMRRAQDRTDVGGKRLKVFLGHFKVSPRNE